MVKTRKPITLPVAIRRTLSFAKAGMVHDVPIEQCFGRVLGADLKADHDLPRFDRSLYDGFALSADETASASKDTPVQFEVVGHIGAGSLFEESIGPHEAVRIMTGAPIPKGADSVIMLEMVKELLMNGREHIIVKRKMLRGENISYKGEEVKRESTLVPKGTFINPGIVALLATFGCQSVRVSSKPKVGILSTGSELIEPREPLAAGKIRNSNAYMIISQVLRAGGDPQYFGQFPDDLSLCFEKMRTAMDECDILITTGGVSVGDFDHLPALFDMLGANVLFNKVAMRPGSVTTVAEKDGKLIFGLSGNPSSCYVGFELFARPIIRRFLHCRHPLNKIETADLSADFPKPNPFTRFVRGSRNVQNGKVLATPIGLDKSGVVSSLACSDILIVLPGGSSGYKKGMNVQIILLEDQEGSPFDRVEDLAKKKGAVVVGSSV